MKEPPWGNSEQLDPRFVELVSNSHEVATTYFEILKKTETN